MRILAILALAAGFGTCAFAEGENTAAKEASFAQFKQEAVKNIDERIANLTAMKTCMSAAADMAGIKQCREKHREAMKDTRGEMKEKRIKNIEKRQQKLEEKKQKLQSESKAAQPAQ